MGKTIKTPASADRNTGAPSVAPVMRWPVWMDAQYAAVTTSVEGKQVAVPAATDGVIARANPRRWAIGFVALNTNAQPVAIGAYGDLATAPMVSLNPGAVVWYKLFDYGPLVTREWRGLCPGGGSVQPIELVLT